MSIKKRISSLFKKFKNFYMKHYNKNKVLTILLTIIATPILVLLLYYIFVMVFGLLLIIIVFWITFKIAFGSSSKTSSNNNHRNYNYYDNKEEDKKEVKKVIEKKEDNVKVFSNSAKFLREYSYNYSTDIISAQQGLGSYNFVCKAKDFDSGKIIIKLENGKKITDKDIQIKN